MPGFLHNTCAVMRREMGRLTRQPMYFVLMIVLPVVSFAFFALLFNQGAIRNIPIAVLDQDNTTLSRKAVQMIDDTPTAMVAYGIQGMDEGERLMREGRVMAIVQIPAFFEKNILSNSQTHLENYVSGTNITVNGLLSKDIQTAVTTFTAGIQLQVLMKQGLTQRQAMAQLMPVRFDKHVLFNPHINYGYYLSPSFMPMMLMIFVMILLFGVELLGYRLWLRKAKRNARELGIFTPTHSSRWLSFLRSIWIFVFWALMVIPLLFRSAGLCIVLVSTGVVLVPVGGAVLVGKQVRKRSVPPKKRRLILVLTVLCSVLLSVMLMIGVMTYGISSGWFDDVPKNAEEYTYTVGGSPQVGYLYHDTLPLYVQDLTDTDYARYSCEALERGDSVFVRQVEYRQELPYDVRWSDENDPPLPELFYTVIDVKLAPLFDFCLQSTLHAEDLYGSEYRETDPAPWGADRAWRECDAHSGEKYDTWLLIYGQRIVEFHPRSFSPDAAQMAVIGETLGK